MKRNIFICTKKILPNLTDLLIMMMMMMTSWLRWWFPTSSSLQLDPPRLSARPTTSPLACEGNIFVFSTNRIHHINVTFGLWGKSDYGSCAFCFLLESKALFSDMIGQLEEINLTLPYLPIRARATLSFLLLPPLYCPQGLSKYWVRSTKLANFSSSLLIRFSELRRPRIRAKRVNISRPVNTLKKGEWGFCDENENEIDMILHITMICLTTSIIESNCGQ